MILEETIQKLVEMKLNAMAAMLRERAAAPATEPLSTDEMIGLLVDREWMASGWRVRTSGSIAC
ncbi:hypothetical protein [Sorangium sp. So ce1151]|uniref:hypothetical protein n=1 Tax=Sorangium sp. So ce1151 TaxID=3133332 RepID=UPI003F617E9B